MAVVSDARMRAEDAVALACKGAIAILLMRDPTSFWLIEKAWQVPNSCEAIRQCAALLREDDEGRPLAANVPWETEWLSATVEKQL